MFNTKQFLAYLDHGACVVVKNKYNGYQIFSPDVDYGGDYRRSDWYLSIETAKKYISCDYGYSLEQIEKYSKEKNWEIVDIYYPKLKPFTVGQKVKVIETGEIFTIKNVFGGEGKGEFFYDIADDFDDPSHTELLPVVDEEKEPTMTDEEMIEHLEKKGRLVEGKVIKI